ncbi:MAG: calcium-binding protein [Actinomycetota bacterium]
MKQVVAVVVALLVAASTVVLGALEASAQGGDPNSCASGALELDGSCVIGGQAGCPDAFLAIPGGTPECARFEFARQLAETCPLGAVGTTATGCYIVVPQDALNCPIDGVEFANACLQVVARAPVCPPDPPVDCFAIEDRILGDCPAATIPVLNNGVLVECRVPVPTFQDTTCAAGFDFVHNDCHRLIGPGPACVAGLVAIAGQCYLEGDPPVVGPPTCPQIVGVVQDGCYRVVSRVYECAFGAQLLGTGECGRAVAPPVGPFTCAAGQTLVNDQCLVPYAPVGPLPCDGSEFVAGLCMAVGAPPQFAGFVCPTIAGVIDDATGCYFANPLPGDGNCPSGYPDPVANPVRCRLDVDRVASKVLCEAGFNRLGADRCGAVTGIVIDPSSARCPTGSFDDGTGTCRRPVANAAGAYVCDAPSAVLDGKACVFTASAATLCGGLPVTHDLNLLGVTAITGTGGDDVFLGTPAADTIVGAGGNDTICGMDGDDVLWGIAGNDTIFGGMGNDILLGGADLDTMYGEGGNDQIWGFAGNDVIFGAAGNDIMQGMDGDDTMTGGTGINTFVGNDGNDTMTGGPDVDVIWGLLGNDIMFGGAGNDVLLGNGGDDTGDGGPGIDWVLGHDGVDTLSGGDDGDLVWGGPGDDTVSGGPGDDFVVVGEEGADTVNGDAGNDTLLGDNVGLPPGNDTLNGGPGNDVLWGFAGDDTLNGDDGNDVLLGGDGVADRCDGGTGTDATDGFCETVLNVP